LLDDEPSGDKLTPVTTVGANTMSCRVNDGVWEARCDAQSFEKGYLGVEAKYGVAENGVPRLIVRAERMVEKKSTFVSLFVDSIKGPGFYPLEKIGFRQGSYRNVEEGTNKMDYYTDTSKAAYLNITTIDTVNRVIAGTFRFTVKNAIGRPVTVDDGRFDVKYTAFPQSKRTSALVRY